MMGTSTTVQPAASYLTECMLTIMVEKKTPVLLITFECAPPLGCPWEKPQKTNHACCLALFSSVMFSPAVHWGPGCGIYMVASNNGVQFQ